MTNLLMAAGALLTLALAAPANASTNLLVNGGFESGDFSGWHGHDTFGGLFGVFSAPMDGISPQDGKYAAYMAPVVGDGGFLYQDWTDTPGATYKITGWYAAYVPVGSGGYFFIGAPGEPTSDGIHFPLTIQTFNVGLGLSIPWTEFSYTYTGTGYEMLDFGGGTQSGYFFADNFVDTQVPEATTWAMMMVGFGGLSLAGWLAKRKSTAGA
jgi:hypothetical protein